MRMRSWLNALRYQITESRQRTRRSIHRPRHNSTVSTVASVLERLESRVVLTVPSPVPTLGLQAYYSFDGDLTDAVGNADGVDVVGERRNR